MSTRRARWRAFCNYGKKAYPFEQGHTVVSPLAQAGATVPLNRRWAFHLDVGYTHHSNDLAAPGRNDFDLSVSAFALRAVLQMKL